MCVSQLQHMVAIYVKVTIPALKQVPLVLQKQTTTWAPLVILPMSFSVPKLASIK